MRCAIYTRKSVDERADPQLSSIDNQRDLCEKYVASQAGDGWTALAQRYDDPGYSGGNLKRPALTNLLADIAAGLIDIVIVYKIDRLSRSLRDFLELVNRFEARNVSLVAITQNFSTTSSMGRLTLNVLLSFAQFERELTSERLKDWFAGARERGLWQGPAPYGYTVSRGVLSVNPAQAETIRHIFRRYPVIGSGKAVADEVNRLGALNQWGRPLDGWNVLRVIRNRLYLGELPHRGEFLPGIHEPIVTERQWRRAKAELDRKVRRTQARRRIPPKAPLKGILYDRNGAPMIHIVYWRRGATHRYYVPSRQRYGPATSPDDRYRAGELDRAVRDVIERIACMPPEDDRPGWLSGAFRRLIARVDMRDDRMIVTLITGAAFDAPFAGRVAETTRTRGRSVVTPAR